MTERYLLFDSGCSVCTRLAEDIERASDGWLMARSLRDPEVKTLLDAAQPGWRWEPTLLEVTDGRPRVFTGIAMRLKLLHGVGVKRAWRILGLITNEVSRIAETQPINSQRRLFMKRTGFLLAGVVLSSRFLPTTVHAQREDPRKTGNPGKVPQSEGVIAYEIEEITGGLLVHFTHTKKERSGTVQIQGLTVSQTSVDLVRSSFVIGFVLDRANASFTFKDNAGYIAHFVFADGVWKADDPDARRYIESNTSDISLAAAICSDFELPPTRVTTQSEITAAVSCPCSSGSNYVRGTSGISTYRSLACEYATNDANGKCTNSYCIGCCRLLSCDCACIVGDYVCSCGRIGYYCAGQCT
jgi:hypothetical protein